MRQSTTGPISLTGGIVNFNAFITAIGSITGSGTVTIGAGLLNFIAADSYTGPTMINGGILSLNDASAPGAPIIFGGGTLQYSSANSTDYSVRFSQSSGQAYSIDTNGQVVSFNTPLTSVGGSFTKRGLGVLTLNVANTYDGTTTVLGGTLRLGVANAVGSGPLTVNGATATLDLNGCGPTVGTVILDGGGTISGGTLTTTASFQMKNGSVSAVLAGTGIALTKTTTGTVTLSGNNTYDSGTTISGGVLGLGSANAIGTTGIISFGGGSLQYSSANSTDYSVRFSQSSGQAYSIDTNGQLVSFNTPLTSSGGSFTKLGLGVLTLNVVNTYSGTTTVSGGTLRYGIDNAIAANSLIVNGPTAVLDLNGHSGKCSSITLDGGGTITGGTLTAVPNNGFQLKSGTVSANLAGTGFNITKSTSGTVTLTGNNTFTGQTFINGGVLQLGNVNALGTSGQISFAGGTLQFSSVNTTDCSSRFVNTPNQVYGIDTNGQAVTFGKPITSSNATFSKYGLGTLTFNATNSFSGLTTIVSGSLRYGVNDAIASGPVSVNGPTAMLDLNGHTDTVGLVTLDGGGTISTGTLTSTASFQMNNGSVNAVLAGSGIALTKSTPGTVVLSGNNVYSGGTAINGGVLQLANANAIGAVGLIVFGGGTLQYGIANTIDYTPRFSNAAGQLYAIDTNGQVVTFSAPLTSNGGTFTKLGPGTLILTGNNTYTGSTSINSGVLMLGNNGNIGSIGMGPVIDNSMLAFNRSDDVSLGNSISGAGGISIISPHSLTLSGAINILGPSSIPNGSANLIMTNHQLDSAGTFSGPGTLQVDAGTTLISDAITVSGLSVKGTNIVRKDGTGTSNISNLTIASTGILDLTNHDLLIGNTNLATVENEILNGFGVGPGGAQITSSTALADGNKIIIPFDATANAITSWDGVPVTEPNTIITKYTYSADANFDGKVDFNDYTVITGNYGQTTPGLADFSASFLAGDLNLDGKVDFNDYSVVTGLYGAGTGGPLGTLTSLNTASVPEPASLAFVGVGAIALLLRDRRAKRGDRNSHI